MKQTNYNLRIANTIKALRKLRGLTQQDMADALFVERSTYCKLENGEVAITVKFLKEVSGVFKFSVFQIFVIAEADILIDLRFTSLSEILLHYTSFIEGSGEGEALSKSELEFIFTKMNSFYKEENKNL